MADYRLLRLYLTIMLLHFLAWLALVYIQELVQFYCIAATIILSCDRNDNKRLKEMNILKLYTIPDSKDNGNIRY